ncbi:hypothetical protein TIFTF001_035079 [Ficus carica]|uniref:peroxidase n=1 Tax=Ficus carica TaxID=3494 RepID=A0AA88E1N0_FICCA|nr:hypothetical protein TIFTF001_035079 [Ficus carica]
MYIQGCDASICFDNTDTIVSEKQSRSSNNSIRGFAVVDDIKTALKNACPGIISCADILAIASEESVHLSGGPCWDVPLGRRDSLTTNLTLANEAIPSPFSTLDQLKANLLNQGINSNDLVVLLGRYALKAVTTVSYISNLDQTTVNAFDNTYFSNLLGKNGLLQSDQELFSSSGADTAAIISTFSDDQKAFFNSFVVPMIKMGNIWVLSGTEREIRKNYIRINGDTSGGLVADY